jgi:hypothetical protein
MSREQIIFNESNHTYEVNGRQYPSVTTVLKNVGLTPDLSMTDPKILERKRIIGTEVHKVIELDLQDDLDGYDPILEPYIIAWKQFRADLAIKLIETELPIFSARYGYCGKLDLLADFSGGKGLFDFKTSSVIDTKGVPLQLAAYDWAYREWSGDIKSKPYKRYAVQLKDDGKYKLCPFIGENDLNLFLYALQIKNYKEAIS